MILGIVIVVCYTILAILAVALDHPDERSVTAVVAGLMGVFPGILAVIVTIAVESMR